MDSDLDQLIHIHVDVYSKALESTNINFSSSRFFDITCGMVYTKGVDLDYMEFRVIDNKKFQMARLKHGF